MEIGILDQITQQFLTEFNKDAIFLQQAAYNLFQYLAIIQIAGTSLWLSLTGESLLESFAHILKSIILLAIFYALIEFGSSWLPMIINGFIDVGHQASNVKSLNPSNILKQGIEIASVLMDAFSGWGLLSHPFVAILGAISCLAIVIIYALIAAELTILLIKSYILVATSSIFFACGAHEKTRNFAVNFIHAVVGLGIRLMITYLILGVGQDLGSEWAVLTKNAAANHEATSMFVVLAAVIVYFLIFKSIPNFLASLASGGHSTNYSSAAFSSAFYASSMLLRTKNNVANKIVSTAKIANKILPPNFGAKK